MPCTSTGSSRKVRARSTTRTITRDRAMARGAINPRVRAAAKRRVSNYRRYRARRAKAALGSKKRVRK